MRKELFYVNQYFCEKCIKKLPSQKYQKVY